MGLGKTLSIIALIVAQKEQEPPQYAETVEEEQEHPQTEETAEDVFLKRSNGTLIICVASVVGKLIKIINCGWHSLLLFYPIISRPMGERDQESVQREYAESRHLSRQQSGEEVCFYAAHVRCRFDDVSGTTLN